jgi:hypothetical protein
MEQMMAHLLAEMNLKEMRGEVRASHEGLMAVMKAAHKELIAIMETNQEKMMSITNG